MATDSPEQDSHTYIVRYGTMKLLGEFEARRPSDYHRGDEVVVRSERGVEWGTVLCSATDKSAEYLGRNKASGGRILRLGSDEDRRSLQDLSEREKQFFQSANRMVTERRMQM